MTKLNDIFAIENAAKDHLIQPWDEIKSLGSEIRPIISSAENIYLIDANVYSVVLVLVVHQVL